VKTYSEALAYLYSFANYEVSAMTPRTDLRLARMRKLLRLSGNPHVNFRSVLIAGTKGKGSTAAMLASIAQAGGLHAGLYTTPHLNTHRERMRIDGQLISRTEFIERMRRVRDIVCRYGEDDLGPPTTYELGTLLAFQYFSDHDVDLAVVEVGLGGRLDATNVLEPDVSIITSISYDHIEVLGHTLAAIAREKAGIIRPAKPLVTTRQRISARRVIEEVAREKRAPVIMAGPAPARGSSCIEAGKPLPRIGQDLWIGVPVWLPLLGDAQLENVGVAVATARELGFTDDAIRRGLESVRWPGRLEVARGRPLVLLDGAHNVDSMRKLASSIKKHFAYERLRVVCGFSTDKDIPGMAAILNELADEVVLMRSKHPRAADPSKIREHFPGARTAGDLKEALEGQRVDGELALVTGSLYLVGDARLQLGLVAPEDQDPL